MTTRMRCFNSRKWQEAGGDVGDNSQFWEEVEVLEKYRDKGDLLARVRWPDGSVTHGHFVSGLYPTKENMHFRKD